VLVALRRRAWRVTNGSVTARASALRTRRALSTGGALLSLKTWRVDVSAEAPTFGGLRAEAVNVVSANKLRCVDSALEAAMAVTLLQRSPAVSTAPAPPATGEGLRCVGKPQGRERGAKRAISRPLYRLASRDVVLGYPLASSSKSSDTSSPPFA
jgi:hypothetical protein